MLPRNYFLVPINTTGRNAQTAAIGGFSARTAQLLCSGGLYRLATRQEVIDAAPVWLGTEADLAAELGTATRTA